MTIKSEQLKVAASQLNPA